MVLDHKITFNTLLQFSSKIIGLILSIFTVALTARYLGTKGFGQYSIILAFLQLFGTLMDLGLSMMVIQMTPYQKEGKEARETETKIFNNIFTLRFFSALFFLFLAPLVSFFFPYPPLIKIGIALTSFSFFFLFLAQIIIPLFQKRLAVKRVAIGEIMSRSILLIFTALAIWLKMGLWGILGAIILGNLVNFLILFFSSLRFVKISLQFDFSLWKEILKKTWPIGLSIALNLIYFRSDTVILSLYRSQEEVGIYGITYKILEALSLFPLVFVGLTLPLLTKVWVQKNLDQFRKILQYGFDFLLILALPLVTGILFLARPIIILISGEEFALAGDVLKIIILATGIIFVGTLFSHTIVAIHKQKTMLWFYLVDAIIAMTAYLIFIPRYSYYAAAIITVFSELFLYFFAFLIVWRTTRILPSLKIFWKSLKACLIMALLLWFFKEQSLFLLLLLANISYFGTLHLLKGWPERLEEEKIDQ